MPLLIFGLLMGIAMRSSSVSLSDAVNRGNLLQTQVQIEKTIEEMDSLNLTFSVNWDILRTLIRTMQYEEYSGTSLSQVKKLTTNYLIPAVAARPSVHSLYIYLDNPYGRFLSASDYVVELDSYHDTSWFPHYEASKQEGATLNSQLRSIKRYGFEKSPQEVITLYKRFFMRQGVVVLNLHKSFFDKQLHSQVTGENQRLLVIGNEGQILMQSHSDVLLSASDIQGILASSAQTFPTYALKNETYRVTRTTSDTLGWIYLSLTPLSELYAMPNRLLTLMIIGLIAVALICAYFATRYARRSHQSLMGIVSTLERMDQPHSDEPPHTPPTDAYALITENIVRNFAYENALKHQINQQQIETKMLELTALRSQLHPHFLFNTLQSIYWMSHSQAGGPNDVSRMIENMTGILAYSLDSAETLVPISTEIQNTKAYIDLQHMRYKDRFTVQWDFTQEVLSEYIPKLLLQPMLENAITHGIRWETQEPLHVVISISHIQEEIHIRVRDDGCGITPEALDALINRLDNPIDADHIGLANCHKRLRLNFGSEYGLKLSSDGGFQIDLRLPRVQPPEKEV